MFDTSNTSSTSLWPAVRSGVLSLLRPFSFLALYAPDRLINRLLTYSTLQETRNEIERFNRNQTKTLSMIILERHSLGESDMANLKSTKELLAESETYKYFDK